MQRQNANMLPEPAANRTPLHTRTITYQGFARADGLWDMEGILHDAKHYDHPHEFGTRSAGQPVHHLAVRVTLDAHFTIQAIEAAMGATPFAECGVANRNLQRLVGRTLGKGWRKTIDAEIGGLQGCTHIRELLANLATAAFQTIPHHQEMQRMSQGEAGWRVHDESPPFFMGQCMTWDFNGPVVARLAPKFVGWVRPAK